MIGYNHHFGRNREGSVSNLEEYSELYGFNVHMVSPYILKEMLKISIQLGAKLASKGEIQSMIQLCIKNLERINFFRPKEKKPIMLENLRNIFYKMDLSDKETRILSSVFASLGKKR